jgi:hypothetical protein
MNLKGKGLVILSSYARDITEIDKIHAVMEIEQAMPDKFILNMSGTRITFS